ncbi:MAG: peptidyl-prolyl cis-trans isomerase [Chlorobium sp.]|uniref:peptidylprolyl isomerase n=1 Tax=Chlorobium sp. TaxID=1095 RepID=UPI0025C65A61|nr:peptidylprolyl isomerase [Chlorobium sp.]MCF8216483.1 peptidyl-prolyl cis-trans isomerase [Chlorobium sp.]MCF8271388.1 peptidyl-prolyl cis-trans isomerase [Chlorobium sp.]MCF8287760.1 peptidyl-prolyl cis-trans isomerase [Chlorobium sp.]MCF8291299.1 peptidyl-prolyl cis-trans isomerase [Chlorobium sp.]MCF8385394.1 peptidyl-prolyl cis-trans isomerase [Chlorobium sp.]
MALIATLGTREVSADEVFPLLSSSGLWPQLMREMVIDRVLRSLDCSFEEVEAYYRKPLAEDSDFFEKRQQQMTLEGVGEQDLDFFLKKPVLLERFRQEMFAGKVENAFLSMKTGLDKVVFSMIRNRNHELIREVYFRLESGEETFSSLASKYSEGREASSFGQIGPVELKQLNPVLARKLHIAQPGVLNAPIVIDGLGVITLLREKIAARLDDAMRQRIIAQLFDEWVKKEVAGYFYQEIGDGEDGKQ